MTVIATYDPYLVALSIAVACLASYTALDLGGRIRDSRRWGRLAWLATAAIAMGGGIWSMHFIGMLAFVMPMIVSYHFGLTLLSLVVAIGVTGFGFFMIGTRRVTAPEFVLSGIFMGIGIAAMHYTGMAAMRMPADLRYDRVLVALSVIIAIGASITALWLAFRTTVIWQRLLAAVVMGSAISGMHYTGMAAATFIADPGMDGARGVPVSAQTYLALAIATITFVILLLTLVVSTFDRKLTRLAERETALLRESEQRLRKLYCETPLPLHAVGVDGRIEQVSNAWLKLLGYPREDTIGRDVTDFMTEDSKRRYKKTVWPSLRAGNDVQEVECRLVRKSGEVLDVLLNAHEERVDAKPVRVLGGIVDITARKRAESRLAEREAQLALFIEDAPVAIAMFDNKMRYLAVSSRFLSDYKLPAVAEIIGRSHYETVPDTPRRWRELYARVLAGEELGHEEDPFPRQDGRIERVQWSMKPWRTADGRIGGALLFSQFVTGILADREARFQATFENAAVGIAHVAPDGRWLRVNQALSRILGYPVDELLTKSFQDVTYPDDLADDLAQVELMRDGKIDSYDAEKRCLRKNGSIIWGRKTVSCVRKEDRSVDYFVSVIEDVTARKQAEELLRRQAALLDQSHDAIFTWKIGGGITYWSRGAETLYGYTQEEAIGRSSHELLQTRHSVPMEEIEAQIARTGSWYGELSHTTRIGRMIVVESRHVRVIYNGEIHALETNRDITTRKQAEQDLRASKDRLELALSAAQLGSWQYDPRHRVFSWDTRVKEIFDFAGHEAPIEETLTRVHPEDTERVWASINAALDPAHPKRSETEFRVQRGDGQVRWVETMRLARFEGVGRERRAVSVVGTMQDITERKGREEKERLLMREVNHRAKNMLSVVESIARQTAVKNPEDFVECFSERIQALSANQDLLVRNEWQGVGVEELVRAQLAHFADFVGSRIAVGGPRLRLNAASAQAIGLALHELGTNAGKYGALSTDTGRVDIGWGTDGDTLSISWTERDGPPVFPPERSGFGTIVIKAMTERSVGGAVDLDYAPSGLTWCLTCPAANALEPSGLSERNFRSSGKPN